jgi:hypothetical protein
MKFAAPKPRRSNETVPAYVGKCNMWLVMFKRMLKLNINRTKLLSCKNRLFMEPNIRWTITEPDYDIIAILEFYLNHLECTYDSKTSCCYYQASNLVRCPNTVTPINTVIRTLEYGGVRIAPICWIRPIYREFVRIISDN